MDDKQLAVCGSALIGTKRFLNSRNLIWDSVNSCWQQMNLNFPGSPYYKEKATGEVLKDLEQFLANSGVEEWKDLAFWCLHVIERMTK